MVSIAMASLKTKTIRMGIIWSKEKHFRIQCARQIHSPINMENSENDGRVLGEYATCKEDPYNTKPKGPL